METYCVAVLMSLIMKLSAALASCLSSLTFDLPPHFAKLGRPPLPLGFQQHKGGGRDLHSSAFAGVKAHKSV